MPLAGTLLVLCSDWRRSLVPLVGAVAICTARAGLCRYVGFAPSPGTRPFGLPRRYSLNPVTRRLRRATAFSRPWGAAMRTTVSRALVIAVYSHSRVTSGEFSTTTMTLAVADPCARWQVIA